MRIIIGFTILVAVAVAVLFLTGKRGEVREITVTSATSDCIGDLKSPTCAVETLFACEARLDGTLCSAALHGSDAKRCKSDPLSPGCEDLSTDVYDEMHGDARYRIGAIRPLTPAEQSEKPFSKNPPPELVVRQGEG